MSDFNPITECGKVHPYTCGNDECRAKTKGAPLRAVEGGWVCDHCSYTQLQDLPKPKTKPIMSIIPDTPEPLPSHRLAEGEARTYSSPVKKNGVDTDHRLYAVNYRTSGRSIIKRYASSLAAQAFLESFREHHDAPAALAAAEVVARELDKRHHNGRRRAARTDVPCFFTEPELELRQREIAEAAARHFESKCQLFEIQNASLSAALGQLKENCLRQQQSQPIVIKLVRRNWFMRWFRRFMLVCQPVPPEAWPEALQNCEFYELNRQ